MSVGFRKSPLASVAIPTLCFGRINLRAKSITCRIGGTMSSPRILVADDEPALLRLLEFVLGRRGLEIHGVSNGDAAVELLETNPPDLAILDVMMPGLDGYEVLRFIRDNPVLAGIPVVMLTARAQLDDIQQGLSLGADAYLAKPFDPEELLSVVESLIG